MCDININLVIPMVKRVAVAFNDKEYEQLMRRCSDCRPIETPYGFIKQLVLNEIGEKQIAREKSIRDNLGTNGVDGQKVGRSIESDSREERIIEDID